MISFQQKDRDACPIQPAEFTAKKQANGSVFPFSVIDIPRDYHEGDFEFERARYEIGKSVAACCCELPGDSVIFQA